PGRTLMKRTFILAESSAWMQIPVLNFTSAWPPPSKSWTTPSNSVTLSRFKPACLAKQPPRNLIRRVGQDDRPALPASHSVLKMGRQAAIRSEIGPIVSRKQDCRPAQGRHRLDCQHHAVFDQWLAAPG